MEPLIEVEPKSPPDRPWVVEAIRKLQRDQNRSADTHLHAVPMPGLSGIDLYLKTSPPIPSAASSIGWRARCSCTACAAG